MLSVEPHVEAAAVTQDGGTAPPGALMRAICRWPPSSHRACGSSWTRAPFLAQSGHKEKATLRAKICGNVTGSGEPLGWGPARAAALIKQGICPSHSRVCPEGR